MPDDTQTKGPPHFFTVDVEEYFQVGAFERFISRSEWTSFESRVEWGVERILEALSKHGATATFFTLGWIAERHPEMMRRISSEGHEVASHGWGHVRVHRISREDFREEARRSKSVLEDVAEAPVFGFRAPNFSIVPGSEWALDVLLEEGYRYDSSLFPIYRNGYGYPGCPSGPFVVKRPGGLLVEIPLSARTFAGIPIPAAGGAYFRTLPYVVAERTFSHFASRGSPACFYVHPWELDPDQPRISVDWITRRRHYGGLARMQEKMHRLLEDFPFTSIAMGLGMIGGSARVTGVRQGSGEWPDDLDLPVVSLPR